MNIKIRNYLIIPFLFIMTVLGIFKVIEDGGIYMSNPTGEIGIPIDPNKNLCEQHAEAFRYKACFFKVTEKKMKGRYYYFSGLDTLRQKQEFAEYAFHRQFTETDIGDFIFKKKGKVNFNIIKGNDTISINWMCDSDKTIE